MLAENFAYRGLIKYFEEISAIPRRTFHEEKIADYICDFARGRGLEFTRDKINNVFVRLPATAGRENEEAILLQGHTDMVCEKNADTVHDFDTDGLELYESDGWLRAKGTTLGADNGVAVATMLYILDGAEDNIPSHPPIECLFTVSEEIGLCGAREFDYSLVSATRMINMDSADERLIIAGCAGGQRTTLTLEPATERSIGAIVRLKMGGLAGGHSGEDIHRGRANANKLMAKLLYSLLEESGLRLVSFNGGTKENAIPRECEAVVLLDDAEVFIDKVLALSDSIKGSLIWLAFIETDDGKIRVRLRSRFVTVNALAERYSGGGHACAAGATVTSKAEMKKLIAEADALLAEYKSKNEGWL